MNKKDTKQYKIEKLIINGNEVRENEELYFKSDGIETSTINTTINQRIPSFASTSRMLIHPNDKLYNMFKEHDSVELKISGFFNLKDQVHKCHLIFKGKVEEVFHSSINIVLTKTEPDTLWKLVLFNKEEGWLTMGELIDKLEVGEVAVCENGTSHVTLTDKGHFSFCDRDGNHMAFLDFYVTKPNRERLYRILPKYVSFNEAMEALKQDKLVHFIDDKEGKHRMRLSYDMEDSSLVNVEWQELFNGKFTIQEVY